MSQLDACGGGPVDFKGMGPRDAVAADICAAQRGCDVAIGRLFAACRDYLMKIANEVLSSQVRGKFGPSDVVQETFLQLGQNFSRFHGATETELKAWMRGALLRNALDMTRDFTGTKKRQISRELQIRGDSAGANETELIDGGENSPPRHLVAAEEAAQLEAALDRMPDAYRQVIRLRHWERLSFPEVGAALGRSGEAARKLWARAILRLKLELAGEANVCEETADG